MNNYSVHSYHLNVGQGDAAVHLLLQQNIRRFDVKAAVLIDGGDAIGFPVLKKGIETIRKDSRYIFPKGTPKNYIEFDSIVVTHWDSDHYVGLQKLLIADYQQQDPGPGITPGRKQIRSNYMKYNPDDDSQPLTTLYVPYWEAIESSFVGQSAARPLGWRKKKFFDILEIEVQFPDEPPVWVMQVAKICSTTGKNDNRKKGIIGRNLFLRDGRCLRAKRTIEEITNPGLLLSAPPQPLGLYCIGSDGQFIGKPRSKDFFVIDDSSKNTLVNKASIMCVIVSGLGTVLHYFGGDVAFESEQHIAPWAGFTLSNPGRLPAMKLGHHGASSSSPESLLNVMRPDFLVASCGEEYGHPSKWSMLIIPPDHLRILT
jgi:hypothetical protein